ncbi:uncharacterized protein [Cherax quadricarinatus]|uniref:uncharacterized protein isoform X2 n=1 Tax=Cherax quadricarinatus TaxID=27406 RepID=UPI0023789034|nr:uncharacterized protein LOC128684957 isoform X2 [Cherax quadricarinatus]
MTMTSIPFVGHLYLPFLLTSLIVGMIILILFEKRKYREKNRLERKYTTGVKPVSNGVHSASDGKLAVDVSHKADIETVKSLESENNQNAMGFKCLSAKLKEQGKSMNSQVIINKPSFQTEENAQESTSCGSSSENDTPKLTRKLSHAQKKHSCSNAKTCSNKKTFSKVIIVTDINEDQIKEPTQLNLFLVTSSNECEELHDSVLRVRETRGCVPAFLYSVSCITDASSGEIYKSAERLCVVLSDVGGTAWLPLTCITYAEETQDPSVLSHHKYITKVLNKHKKMSKKCCGTSCSSKKAVDIEDLGVSLLPAVTPVKT